MRLRGGHNLSAALRQEVGGSIAWRNRALFDNYYIFRNTWSIRFTQIIDLRILLVINALMIN
jgi:hypothetical protein